MSSIRQGAVLGHPIGHSKSPALHNAAYTALELDFQYQAIDIDLAELPTFFKQVRVEGHWFGLSVTMPLKNAAAALVDELTPVARILGSVNTVVISENDGVTHLLGDNTDVAGIVNALRHAGVGERPRGAILGGGGTAVSAVAALCALESTDIDIFVRHPLKAADTLEVAKQLGAAAHLLPFQGAASALAGYDVVISTLPPQGADGVAQEFGASAAQMAGACLLDVAYDPWPSALASAWESKGGTVIPGIEMLLYQGLEQVKLFAGASGHQDRVQERIGDVTNVMCDALGLERRLPFK